MLAIESAEGPDLLFGVSPSERERLKLLDVKHVIVTRNVVHEHEDDTATHNLYSYAGTLLHGDLEAIAAKEKR